MNEDTNGVENPETEDTAMNTSATEDTGVDSATSESQDFISSNVEVADEGPCRKRMSITIAPETVTAELETQFKQLKSNVMLPGFRKGKAPLKMIKAKFGKDIEQDVREDLINRSVSEQMENADYTPIGFPEFENIEFSTENPFTFEAVFDVQPTFDLPEYKGVEVDSQLKTVEDSDVDAEIERISEQASTLEPLEVGSQAEGDFVVVDLDLTADGESIFSRDEVI